MSEYTEFMLDKIGIDQLSRLSGLLVPTPKKTLWERIWRRLNNPFRPVRTLRAKHDSVSMQSHYDKIWRRKSLHAEFAGGVPTCKISDHRRVMFSGQCFYSPDRWLTAAQVICVASHIRQASPETVIEVGSGSGMLMIALASMFPEKRFVGLELTEAGIESAMNAMQDRSLVTTICNFIFGDVALSDIVFPMTNLSFERLDISKSSPDLRAQFVFSSLAFEQMETVFDSAFGNSLALCTDSAMFMEPFLEFNSSRQRRTLKSKKYLYRKIPLTKLTEDWKVQIQTMPKHLNKTKYAFGVLRIDRL